MPEVAVTDRLAREVMFLVFSSGNSVDPWMRHQVLRRLGERHLAAGEAIWLQGDAPDLVYFMRSGRVEFSRPGASPFAREGRWVFGVHEALAAAPRYRDAVAGTDLTLLTLPGETWLELVDEDPNLTRRMAMNTITSVAALHDRLAPDGGFVEPDTACAAPGGPFSVVERLVFLRRVPFLARAGVQSLADVARACEEVSFAEGEVIVARGAPRRRVVVVIDGLVEARRENPTIVGHFGGGSVVGGAAIMSEASQAWEARAVQPTRALTLPMEVWKDEMDDHFDLFRSAIRAMVGERERLLDVLAERNPGLVLR